jgi:PPOX class probable F420-dependent enzyme
VDRAEALIRLAAAPSGHLATIRPDGRPHIVVVTFAVTGGNIVTAIDHKPKTTSRLQRLINIEANRSVSFLVDEYDEDWSRLWWVRVDGPASTHHSGEIWEGAIEALAAKYPQYAERQPEGPVIAISQDRITGWESTK